MSDFRRKEVLTVTEKEYLQAIDEVIAKGPYSDSWASLSGHPVPKWYSDGKFGIFIHWGVYSVPAFGSEWYPRHMYIQGTPEYEHHIKTYGPHKEFGYKDFVPMFKAEKFDPDQWAELFAEAGAKYVVPVAEHHDGFQMYQSDLCRWNSVEMGPHRDIVGELKKAVEGKGITLCASSHRAEHYFFMNGGTQFDSDVTNPEYADLYGPACAAPEFLPANPDCTHDVESLGASKEHLDNWLVRTCELVDKYQPQIVYFDWWIQNHSFKPYLKKFAAYYYNRAAEWGKEVTINYKYNAYGHTCAVYDVERGQLSGINPRTWQTDTAIAKNSWGYTENNDFKSAKDVIADFVDIVSKNGCMLLNVGPKADGTITEEETAVLKEIGRWLKVNGEGIYGTTYWHQFGEGPTEIPEGHFSDTDRAPFTSEDIRFTYKAGNVYAFVMKMPEDGVVRIRSMASKDGTGFMGTYVAHDDDYIVTGVSLLGEERPVQFERSLDALTVTLPEGVSSDYPLCLKITVD